ncbi:Sulfate starvation-induced protein 2 [Methyloversatilis universalis FAM5]|uniref:Sulfate starvation-induced protein 2 n=1 Tax=Methyloversatilis universalis (strain ATCC BAA-1314 / DSM 25237 / JCM 13912 / CCUG 52030 / FAM5) TaxID=1000565 RepID=F5R9L6_METUF|nr:sulfate ABC transporter substrate-binding protein [Methyloversatilis universalis]EGK72698.1 Sulfate starvation-induced protein 2 [Methyloversatilis universalis FAM5]
MLIRRRTLISAALLSLLAAALPAHADATLLNVSYDVARELYKDINPAFIAQWKGKTGETLTLNQSHGGSSKQAGAVIGGLEADVITMNQSPDIDILVKNNLVSPDWRKRLPNDAAPYTTTTVFLVRKGNPKAIKDWSDLVRPGLQVIVPNPKTSGNGRYTYVAAWGYALSKHNDDAAAAKDFVSKLFANVPVLDGGGRGATTTFTQRGIGDVLITFENEAVLLDKEVGGDQFDIVYPSLSVEAAAPVAVVDKVVDKRGTRKQAEAYLQYLFSPEGQDIIAKHHFRPRNETVLKKYAAQFPAIRTFTVEGRLGGWEAVQKTHFADGALYDQIVTRR